MILRRFSLFLLFGAILWQLNGCAPRPTYYPGKHKFCEYQGPHVHYKPWGGPVSIEDNSPKVIEKKYRTPGIDDSLNDYYKETWK